MSHVLAEKLPVSGILTQSAFAEEESQGLLRLVSYLTVGEQEAPHWGAAYVPGSFGCARFGRSWPHVTSSSQIEKLNSRTVPCEDSNNMSIEKRTLVWDNWGSI